MNKKIASVIVSVSSLLFASVVLADNSVTIPNPLNVTSFCQLLTQIAQQVGSLIAYLGVIMIIISGILYLVSAGNPEKVGMAKKALIYAIGGIAIGLAANAIVDIIKSIIGVSGASC